MLVHYLFRENGQLGKIFFCNKAYQNLYFYGDLVYKFKKIAGKSYFNKLNLLKKINKRHIKVGYNINIMRQSARRFNPLVGAQCGST